jgi:hypothetical protein
MALKFVKKTAEPQVVPELTEVSDLAPVIDEIGKNQVALDKINAEMEKKAEPLRKQLAELIAKDVEKASALSAKITEGVNALTEQVLAEDTVTETDGDLIAIVGSKTDADKPLVLKGHKFQVEFTKMGSQRIIKDMKSIPDIVGEDTFWAKCTFPLKALDDYATPEEKELVLKNTKTPRKFAKVEKKL